MARDFEKLVAAEEPSYRRRQRAVTVSRRQSSVARRFLLWTVKASLPVLLLATALALLYSYTSKSSRFDLQGADGIALAGNRFVSRSDVAAAIGAGAEPNLFRLSLDEARRQVEAIPWVRTASLRRVYPDVLQVEIVERTPIAFVNLGGGVRLIDAEGVTLEKPAEASFDFPVLTGIDSTMSPADRRARLALFQQFAQELKLRVNGAGWLVSEADLSDVADVKALLVQGRQTILVHFGDKDFGERFDTFLGLLPQVLKASPSVDAVDLRYRGQLVVSPKEPSSTKAELRPVRR